MNCYRMVQALILSFSLSSLSGCALWEMIRSENAPSANAPVANSPMPAAPPAADPVPAAPGTPAAPASPALTPFTQLASPASGTSTSSARENYGCLTTNYFTNLVWQQNQPTMTFGRQASTPVFRDELAKVTANGDGSFTYEVDKDALFYTRVYPDRTCLIQVVNAASGAATIEELGTLGGLTTLAN